MDVEMVMGVRMWMGMLMGLPGCRKVRLASMRKLVEEEVLM